MTKEEYNIKIAELREQRNFHEEKAREFAMQMDKLQIDEQYNDILKGEYVIIDRKPQGYKTYFHVDTWEKRARGVELAGIGFYTASYGIQKKTKEVLDYEDAIDPYKLTVITKKEYYAALKQAISDFKKIMEQ